VIIADDLRFCEFLPSKQAVAGSSPVSRSTLYIVSLQALLEPLENNQAAKGNARRRFCFGKNACSDILPRPLRHPASLRITLRLPPDAPEAPKEAQRNVFKRPTWPKKRTKRTGHNAPIRINSTKRRATTGSRKVTEARANAQRTKLDAQADAHRRTAEDAARAKPSPGTGKRERERPGNRRGATVERAIADYLLDHAGGNHSAKTLEWHHTALTLMRAYLEEECKITLVENIDAPDLNGWLAHLRTTPGSRGKPRSERTIQTYACSARAFFHWLVRRELIARNPLTEWCSLRSASR
jgi:hypothetical protein